MKFSMTGQEKHDFLIQATAWAGLTIFIQIYIYIYFFFLFYIIMI
jgi:hypothetical protein